MEKHPTQLNFDDTRIAFSSKSNKQLKRSYRLFSLISKSWIAGLGTMLSKFALKARLPIKGLIKNFIFTQFCGGESLEESTKTINQLRDSGVLTVLDYGVEGKETDKDFDRTAAEIKREIVFGKNNPNIPMVSCKMTGLARFALLEKIQAGEKLSNAEENEWQLVQKRFQDICQHAFDNNVGLFVDAEETWIQEPIDNLVMGMAVHYNKKAAMIHSTIQMYRKDSLDLLEKQYNQAREAQCYYGVKLVRGAYMEKERERGEEMNYPSPIHNSKIDSDQSFDNGLRFCMERIENIVLCAATHNENSCLLLANLINESGLSVDDSRTLFSQLYGMSDHITFNLAEAGFRAAKYIPYGPVKDVIPYLTRRAKENTSVEGQMSRELQLLKKEISRRKQS